MPLFAQRTCGTDAVEQNMMLTDPKYQQRREQIEIFTNEFVTNYNGAERAVITIPVVVHVVYNNAIENISDAQILSQIGVLNEDFRKLNTDAASVPAAFASVAADSEIEFCMATVDPNGNPTTGITRTSTTQTSFGTNDQVKSTATGGVNAWPNTQYLNIWVCDITGTILGYAQFPGGAASTDGVVIDYLYFGTIGTATAPFDKGRTATHEVGHWLNLRHIWGDDGTGCTGSDLVADTPNAGGPNYGCPTFPNITCSNGPNGDMFMNYMDYTDDACMYMFTLGQKTRMQSLFAPGGVREALGNSTACGDPNTICNTPVALNESNISDTGVDLTWAAVNGVAEYNLRYRVFGASSWTDVLGLTTSSYSISGLISCTTYEWEVQTSCINTIISNYSTTRSFNTTGCPVSPYCDSYGTTTSDEWIQSVSLSAINNVSGDNGGYAFFPSITTTLDLGQTYTFTGVTGYSSTVWNESWRVWIDFNQDGDYLDAGEQVYTAANVTNGTTGNITIPATALTGITGMRITMMYGATAPTPCQLFTYGEVEDYMVTISGCSAPANLTTSSITDTEATFAWDFNTGVNYYTLQYAVQGSGVWTTVSGITGISYTATGLTACTNYEWQVQTLCDDASTSSYTASQTFTTTGCLVSPYCDSYGQSTVDEWIDSISLNTLSNNSGDNGGYAFFPSVTTTLTMGEQYTFSGTPMHSGTIYNESWSVFIDYNQDGDYLDANETVFIGGPSTTTVTGQISIPVDALSGQTGMRVSMTFGTTAVGPCDIFQWGEVEDYIIIYFRMWFI
ncbi:MAG: GEVED domain-containing protein [Flavobacteriales bacterium]